MQDVTTISTGISALATFIRSATYLSVISALVLVIYQLVKGKSVGDLFSKTTPSDPAPQKTVMVESRITEGELILQRLDKIAGNHLHDLPGMREDMTKMMDTLSDIQKEQNKQGRQLVRLETTLKLPPM